MWLLTIKIKAFSLRSIAKISKIYPGVILSFLLYKRFKEKSSESPSKYSNISKRAIKKILSNEKATLGELVKHPLIAV